MNFQQKPAMMYGVEAVLRGLAEAGVEKPTFSLLAIRVAEYYGATPNEPFRRMLADVLVQYLVCRGVS